MTVVSTMLMNALIMINDRQIGGTFTSTESAYYLQKLNTMLDSWTVDRLMVYQILQENFPLTASTSVYTIGSGGAFNTVRPIRIEKAFVRQLSSSTDTRVDVVPYSVFDDIVMKTIGLTWPTHLYYDAAFPLATIQIYPTPISGLQLYLDSMKQLQSFSTVTDTLTLPNGYQRAIESNAAIEFAPGLTSVSPEVLKIAKESKALIRSINLPDSRLKLDQMVSGKRLSPSIIVGP